MKFCDTHWGRLRDAVIKRNLGEIALASLKDPRIVFPDKRPDPLTSAYASILQNLTDWFGAGILADPPGEERCPLCAAQQCARDQAPSRTKSKQIIRMLEGLIDRAADDERERFKRIPTS